LTPENWFEKLKTPGGSRFSPSKPPNKKRKSEFKNDEPDSGDSLFEQSNLGVHWNQSKSRNGKISFITRGPMTLCPAGTVGTHGFVKKMWVGEMPLQRENSMQISRMGDKVQNLTMNEYGSFRKLPPCGMVTDSHLEKVISGTRWSDTTNSP